MPIFIILTRMQTISEFSVTVKKFHTPYDIQYTIGRVRYYRFKKYSADFYNIHEYADDQWVFSGS